MLLLFQHCSCQWLRAKTEALHGMTSPTFPTPSIPSSPSLAAGSEVFTFSHTCCSFELLIICHNAWKVLPIFKSTIESCFTFQNQLIHLFSFSLCRVNHATHNTGSVLVLEHHGHIVSCHEFTGVSPLLAHEFLSGSTCFTQSLFCQQPKSLAHVRHLINVYWVNE